MYPWSHPSETTKQGVSELNVQQLHMWDDKPPQQCVCVHCDICVIWYMGVVFWGLGRDYHSLARDKDLDKMLIDQQRSKESNGRYQQMLEFRQKLPCCAKRQVYFHDRNTFMTEKLHWLPLCDGFTLRLSSLFMKPFGAWLLAIFAN